MSEELKAAQARIACLEGEIAKRDAELAACRVAVENCEVFRARIVELEHRCGVYGLELHNATERLQQAERQIKAIKAQEQVAYIPVDRKFLEEIADSLDYDVRDVRDKVRSLLAAPVSEAKAQGVVQWPEADEIMQMAFEEGQPADDASGYCFELEEFDLFIERLMSDVARLNAVPVQKVSMPDGKVCVPVEVLRLYEFMAASFTPFTSQHEQIAISLRKAKAAMLAAAPAAPAADAGLVEALKQAFPLFDEDGLNELYHHCEIAVLGDRKRLHKLLATHSAKGVV